MLWQKSMDDGYEIEKPSGHRSGLILVDVFMSERINSAYEVKRFIRSVIKNPGAKKVHLLTDFGRVTLLYSGPFDCEDLKNQYEKFVKFETKKWVMEEE